MRPIHAVPAVLLAAAALAGCGGGNGSGTTADAPSAGTTQQAHTTPTQAQTSTTKKWSSGGGASADAAGARVFVSAGCASCHTLKAANASGNAGPNLDDLKPSFDAVKTQVTNGGGGMPSFNGQLSGAQIDAVARFVSDRAGS